jgi:hypothetical protein
VRGNLEWEAVVPAGETIKVIKDDVDNTVTIMMLWVNREVIRSVVQHTTGHDFAGRQTDEWSQKTAYPLRKRWRHVQEAPTLHPLPSADATATFLATRRRLAHPQKTPRQSHSPYLPSPRLPAPDRQILQRDPIPTVLRYAMLSYDATLCQTPDQTGPSKLGPVSMPLLVPSKKRKQRERQSILPPYPQKHKRAIL